MRRDISDSPGKQNPSKSAVSGKEIRHKLVEG